MVPAHRKSQQSAIFILQDTAKLDIQNRYIGEGEGECLIGLTRKCGIMATTFDASVVQPDMESLEGKWSRRVFEAIVRAPKPDFTEFDRRCRESEEVIRKTKANGTY